MASSLYERWVNGLGFPWLADKGRLIWSAFASILGDRSVDESTQVNFEHMPEYAHADSNALTSSERQIDAGPSEDPAELAHRLVHAAQLWGFAGTPWGLLLAMHFAGFPGAVIAQQNGLAFNLTLPLPDFLPGAAWDPTPNFVTTVLSQLDVALHSDKTLSRSIPAGTSWWAFDSDTDLCSRFAILFPGVLPSSFLTWGKAIFTGVEDGTTAHPWPLVTWNNAFPDTTYRIQPSAPTVTLGGAVAVYADGSTKTKTGVRIASSSPFVGYVDVLAWQVGANPFADLHPFDLERLQNIVKKWRPGKGTCVGAYALVQGNFIGWPVRTIGAATPGPASVVAYTGGF